LASVKDGPREVSVVSHLQPRRASTRLPDAYTVPTESLVRVGRARLHLSRCPI